MSSIKVEEYEAYLSCDWKNPLSHKSYCDIFVLLFSGVCKNSEYSLKVGKDGLSLSLELKMPEAISDITVLQKIAQAHDPEVGDRLHLLMASISEKFKLMKQNYNSEWTKSFLIPLSS